MKKFLVGSIIVAMLSIGTYLYLGHRETPVCDKAARTFELDYEATGSWSFIGSSQGPAENQSIATKLAGSWTTRCVAATDKERKNEHVFALKDESGVLKAYQIMETIDNQSRVHRIKAPSGIGKREFHGIRDFLARVQFHEITAARSWEKDEQDSTGTYQVSYKVLSDESGHKVVEKSHFESVQGLSGTKVATVYAPHSNVRFAFSDGLLNKVSGVIGITQSMGSETLSQSSIKFTAVLSSNANPSLAREKPGDTTSIEDDFQGTESFKRIERESNIRRLGGAEWKDLARELSEITQESANETFLRLRAYFGLYPERSAQALDALALGKADELAFRTLFDALLQIDDPRVEETLVEALRLREADPAEARYMLQNFGLKGHASEKFLEGIAVQRENPNQDISHIARLSLGNISQTVFQKYPEKTTVYLNEEIDQLKASNNRVSIAENLHVISNYGGQRSFEAIEAYLNSKDEFLLETAVTSLRFAPHDMARKKLLAIINDSRIPKRIQHTAIEEIGFHPLENGDIAQLTDFMLLEKSEAILGSLISVLSRYYDKSETVVQTFRAVLESSVSDDIKSQLRLIAQRNA